MPNINETIKKICNRTIEANQLTDVVFGTVSDLDRKDRKIESIKIRLNESLTIDEDFLIMTESAVDKLNEGDKVVLIRLTGGQEYLFLDRLVTE